MALATPTERAGGDGGPPMVPGAGDLADVGRTGIRLPWRQLFVMSVYWFGIQAIWGGYETFGQEQVKLMVGEESKGLAIGLIESLGAMVALVVQPTAGVISDYTSTRWGRRKAYIIVGSVMDVIFLAGLALIAIPSPGNEWDGQALATTQTVVLYLGLYLCLQFSSNLAQGPFQGYLPDLVPEQQVGAASTIIGVMKPLGLIGGALIMIALGIGLGLWGPALVLIGLIELSLAAITFLYVREGPTGKSAQRPVVVVDRDRGVGHGRRQGALVPAHDDRPLPGPHGDRHLLQRPALLPRSARLCRRGSDAVGLRRERSRGHHRGHRCRDRDAAVGPDRPEADHLGRDRHRRDGDRGPRRCHGCDRSPSSGSPSWGSGPAPTLPSTGR